MTRHSKDQRQLLSVRLPQSLHARLLEAADERDVSANFLMTRAIEEFLSHLIPADEIKFTRDP